MCVTILGNAAKNDITWDGNTLTQMFRCHCYGLKYCHGTLLSSIIFTTENIKKLLGLSKNKIYI